MKVARIKDDEIVLDEAQKPLLEGRSGAIMKVSGCGLCGSDIVKFVQKISPNGTILGHEVVGEIVEINSKTEFKVGDKIVCSHHIPCFECDFCKRGHHSMCRHFKKTNIEPGGFAEFIFLSQEHLKNVAHKIPNTLTEVEASFYEPLGCCVRAIKRSEVKSEQSALVVGLGSIGVLMAEALKAFGVKVSACDVLAERVEFAKNFGINALAASEVEKTYDCVFMTSGSDKAIEPSFKQVKDGGTILIFASTPEGKGYSNNEIYYRELTVLGSYSPTPTDLAQSLALLAEKKVKVAGISTIYGIEDIQKAFCDTISNKIMKAYIKL